jgi:ADP-heptose:LPS heptosyltransferase
VRHEVRRQLDLVATIGAVPRTEGLSITLPARARRRAAAALATLRVPRDGPLVVAHVGATAPSRRYAPHRFAEALDLLVADQRARVILTGDASEVALVESVRAMMRTGSYSLAGCLDFAELCAVIETADVLVSNNTAPAHIAGAVGTPVVDLYALTNPQHVPWRVPHRVLNHDVPCRWCYKSTCPVGHHDCLARVAPGEIAEAVQSLLDCTFEPVCATLAALPATVPDGGAPRARAS